MTLGDETQTLRRFIAETNPAGRWNDYDTGDFINRARKQLMIDWEWPETSIFITAISGQQEYDTRNNTVTPPVEQVNKILRVYVAGQLCVPTTIPLMDGSQIELFDQTALNFTPQWLAVPATSYPVSSDSGFPQTRAPFFPGMRPRFYLRGPFNIGFVPAPLGTPTIQLDIIPTPPLLLAESDPDIFPDNCREAIAWKAAELAMFGDNPNPDKVQMADACYARYLRELKQVLIPWKRNFVEFGPKGPQVLTYRAFFQGAPANTVSGYSTGQNSQSDDE